MRPLTRQGRLVGLLTVLFTLGTLAIAMAEPSPACRALAKQFAEVPEKLKPDQLFRLQACVHREIGHRGVDESSALPSPMPRAPLVPGFAPPAGPQ